MALSVCFIFTVTIGTFPAVTVDVKSTIADGGPWGESLRRLEFSQICVRRFLTAACFASSSETYFIPVACFLLFNVMDWIGRSLTAVCMWVSNSSFLNKRQCCSFFLGLRPG